MNFDRYKKLLQTRQDELQNDIHRYDAEVVDSRVAEVGDNADASVSVFAKSTAADASATANGELGLVEEALERIEKRTYGKCIECGEEIPPARLDAVPWAPYCLHHQKLHDRALGVEKPPTL